MDLHQLFLVVATAAGISLAAVFFYAISRQGTLNSIKSRTVGDGQHGTARWATKLEIAQSYDHVAFTPGLWRKGEKLPTGHQGLIVGSEGPKGKIRALVETEDVHAMVTAASGAGKTAYFLYPNIEYACASGMSFLCTDTKGDLYRNYAGIAKDCYGYQIAVLDLRNPTRSDGNNLLHLINKYMDIYKADPKNLAAKAKSEKYAKILAKTLIHAGGENSHGQNQFFYDSAEGLLTSIFLLLAEYVSDTDEDNTKYAIVSLLLQNLYREILAVADENGGLLKNRVVFYCDELGTIPPIDSLELMFSASRSRRLMLVPIVQSITGQLQKNYGKEGSDGLYVSTFQIRIRRELLAGDQYDCRRPAPVPQYSKAGIE